MKNKLNKFFVLLFLFFSTQVYSSPIEKINFIGLNNSSESELLKIMPIKIGDEYSDSLSNITIQSLFKTELFSDISITFIENPTIKFFDFKLDSGSGFSSWIKGEKMLIGNESLNEMVSLSLSLIHI